MRVRVALKVHAGRDKNALETFLDTCTNEKYDLAMKLLVFGAIEMMTIYFWCFQAYQIIHQISTKTVLIYIKFEQVRNTNDKAK